MTSGRDGPVRIWLVAGEESGDQLGAKLMRTLGRMLGPDRVRFGGVGGHAMAAEGLTSLFPMTDIAVMGVSAVIARLPRIVRRVYQTVDAVVAARPDMLVIIDSPDFTHQVARRVRRRLPQLPIIDYVSPSVWAWRPGRARTMAAYVDHVLALLPFEPEAHRRLRGPACTYVGHPLVERLGEIRRQVPQGDAALGDPVRLLVLPGSRRSEIHRLMGPFGETLGRLRQDGAPDFEVIVPAVAHLADEIARRAEDWPVRPRLVQGEADKWAAFRSADAALAASGTVTLELALAGVPMVVAYKVSKLEEQLKYFIKVPSIVLANLVIGENVIPELIQWDCTPEKLAAALRPLMSETPERHRQKAAFARLDAAIAIGDDLPSERAARVVLDLLKSCPPA